MQQSLEKDREFLGIHIQKQDIYPLQCSFLFTSLVNDLTVIQINIYFYDILSYCIFF